MIKKSFYEAKATSREGLIKTTLIITLRDHSEQGKSSGQKASEDLSYQIR